MLILPAVDAMTGWFIQYVLIFVLQTKDTKTKKKKKSFNRVDIFLQTNMITSIFICVLLGLSNRHCKNENGQSF